MLLILLKSSACLAIFMLFYKLCLEKTSAHSFKRFYLIGSVLISICIPFITFIEYIEVQPEILTNNLTLNNTEHFQAIESTSSKNYIPIVLWSIYILGASIFAFRFFKNLNHLFQKIKRNPKFKNENTFHVLLQELVTPHTFLNYIFLNKTKYENNQIPHEVLLHEQTHANQKHALDVIFIEILQTLFWFNPLLYFIKKDIKLNHEFLADQAVLNKGIAPSTYQNILLAFSSNAPYTPLANAINYSLIKKRFTVMKTKTSKPVFWLRSLIILPLLAILIYSFSSKVVVEKEINSQITKLESISDNEIKIFIDKNRKVFINNNAIDFNVLSQELIKLKNNFIKQNSTIPTLIIEIDDHITNEDLDILKNKIEKSHLTVTRFKSNSLVLDKKRANAYFKETKFTAEYMVFETEDGVLVEGISIPKNTTYSQSENLKSLLKHLKVKETDYTQSLNEVKTQKEKIEIEKQLDFIKSRIKIVDTKLNSKSKSKILQKKIDTKNSLFIKIIDSETIFINNKKCALEDIESRIIELIKEQLSDEKEKLIPSIVYNSPDGDETYKIISNILRGHNLLKINTTPQEKNKLIVNQQKAGKNIAILINKKGQLLVNDKLCKVENLKNYLKKLSTEESEISSVDITTDFYTPKGVITKVKNTLRELGILRVNFKQLTHNNYTYQEATPEQLAEYNKLAKKFNSNPEGIHKAKNIKRVISLYNKMSEKQKKASEPFPKFMIPPPIPKDASPEEINAYKKRYAVYNELTKDLKKQDTSDSPPLAPTHKTPLDQVIEIRSLKPDEKLTIRILEKGNLKINNNTIKINALKGILNGMTYDLTDEEKNNLITQIIVDKKASEETVLKVKDILRENKILKVNFNK